MPTVATPNLLTDAGYVFIAPIGSAEPSNTVVGSKFTDAWPGAWVGAGATEDGSEWNYAMKIEALSVAEFLDPVKYVTTERMGSMGFALADYTLKNLARAINAGPGAVATVSGSGTTLLSSLAPVAAGAEIRQMIGWESLDNTLRLLMYQVINGSAIKSTFKKAKYATIPCEFSFEVPSSGIPWKMYSAGTARVGT